MCNSLLSLMLIFRTTPYSRARPAPHRKWLCSLLAAGTFLGSACVPDGAGDRQEESEAELGRWLVRGYDCGGCHVIPGVAAAIGTVGPPLTDWAERGYIAGALRNTPENLAAFLVAPQQFEPDGGMPDIGVRPEDARLMSVYLFSLGRGLTAPAEPAGRASPSGDR
jgi:hypothetical protein